MALQNTSSGDMASSDDFEAAMMNLGFDKYAYRNGRWVKFSKVDDEIIQRPLAEVYNNPNFRMSIDFLEPGDLLCKSGHVEFYVGYNYDVTYYDPRLGRSSGISSITIGNKADQGHSTFGWGGAQNDFPKQNYYFTYNQTNNGFVWHAGDQTDSDYKVIWRKN